jgi:MoxR-like ATPase
MVPLVTSAEIIAAKNEVHAVYLSEKVLSYIHNLVLATRAHKLILTGLSTRAAINLAQAAKAAAFLAGRDYVAPDDVRDIAVAVCAHRLGLRSEMTAIDRGGVIRTIIAGIALPLA